MGPKQSYPTRNYEVGQYLLTLRSRAKLTQTELASRLGVHRRSVQKWESGETYPTPENLRGLISLWLTLGVFIAGQERVEATGLWQRVSEAAPQPFPLFDTAWFERLLTPLKPQPDPPTAAVLPVGPNRPFELPFQPSPLIGRAQELAEVNRILADPACRLLTLLGPGGIGKTRLAIEVATAQTGRFSDGVAFVPLTSVNATDQIVSAIGEALQLSLAGQAEPAAYLLTYLRERKILLVLDSFEHLIESADLIGDLLQESSHLTLLVTSRTRLNLQAEWLFDVEGLSYPSERNPARSLAELAGYGAVQLFVERARQLQPDLPLPEATLAAIGHICQQLAGMPLALELAAASLRRLPIHEIERQLRSNLDGLATTLHDVPERHRSLRAVFDQSWNLLNEAEQILFSRLAVFRGSWDQLAVKAICAQITKQIGPGFIFTPSVLASLTDKSLVQRSNRQRLARGGLMNPPTEPRFVLLEPIREYAVEKLIARGEAAMLQRAHASYYLSLAEAMAVEADSLTVEAAIEQLDDDYDNIRATLQWARDGGELTLGLRLAGALRKFWQRRGYYSEGRLWLEQLLALEAPTADSIAASVPLSEALPVREGAGRVDWGLAQDVPVLYGRTDELETLNGWVQADGCRVITLVGIGGIGKTSLALTFARQIAPHFATIVFRSLGEAPPFPELLDGLIHSLTSRQVVTESQPADRVALLIELLRQERCLLILDNLETLLQGGTPEAHYLAGYEAYGTLFKALAETSHQSCLLLTSRERLPELAPLEGPQAPVRSLQVTGLPEAACRALLADQALIGTAGDTAALARRFSGNPLALKLVAEPIRALFSGDIATFLTEGSLFFEGVGQLLEQQVSRASALEQALLTWLAIGREPVGLDGLMQNLAGFSAAMGGVSRAVALAALHALWRRNLIERGQQRLTFTLQRVVLEYLTERLVERTAEEITWSNSASPRSGALGASAGIEEGFDELRRYALIQATAKEYVRHSQERLIATPLLERLRAVYGGAGAVERRLLSLLEGWRGQPFPEQGYGPGNVINLLRLLRGHLNGLNLANLALQQLYLQGVEVRDTSLAGAILQDSNFTETFDVVTAVAVSSTGESWAAASRRGELLVWDAGGQTLRRVWRAHTDMVWTLAFSPDGQTLASGSWDGRVKLWDVASGAMLWSGQHTSHANNVAFAPDGRILASGGSDATVRLWDTRTGAQLQTLPHPLPVPIIAWSPAGRLLASGETEGDIRLWELPQHGPAICLQTLTGHTSYMDGLAFSPDGTTLASASWDNTVKLWDIIPGPDGISGRLRETLTGHTDRALRVTWSPDGRVLASCSRDQTVRLWEVEQGSYRAVLHGHTAGVNGLAFAPDSHSLLTGSEDGTLRVWDIASGQCIRLIRGYAASLYDVDWSPAGTHLASSGTDYLVTIYELAGKTPPRLLRGHIGVVFGVGWSPDGRRVASSEWDNIIRLWEPATGACLQVLHHPDDSGNYFYGLAWSPDGQRLAAGTYRRGVQLFEITGQSQPWVGPEFPTWIRHVAWSPDGAQVAGGGDDGAVYIWDATTGALRQRLASHYSRVTRLAWSPDGTQLASGGLGREGGELFVWDPQSGERLHTIADSPRMVYAVAWGSGETLLVSGGGDGMLRWWDVQSGECVRVRQAHQGTVQSLRRSPDGTRLASCGDDGAIMLWDLHTGEHLQTLRRDRPYERLNITGARGLTEAQRMALLALGAVER